MNCPTGKRKYFSEADAENGLIDARIRFHHNKAIGVYECNDCGHWHLTSQGQMNPRLKQELENGSIGREANSVMWERKLK